jgi:hypothetical protein
MHFRMSFSEPHTRISIDAQDSISLPSPGNRGHYNENVIKNSTLHYYKEMEAYKSFYYFEYCLIVAIIIVAHFLKTYHLLVFYCSSPERRRFISATKGKTRSPLP